VLKASPRTPQTATTLIKMFKTTFSEEGGTSRQREERVFADFVRYLREVEGEDLYLG